MFATVPPAQYYSGMPCFAVSILYIAGLTYIVGEFASLFGCALGLRDAVTAISFVALGTSLPDTFASRQAAVESEDADAAIGNVTGAHTHCHPTMQVHVHCRERHTLWACFEMIRGPSRWAIGTCLLQNRPYICRFELCQCISWAWTTLADQLLLLCG